MKKPIIATMLTLAVLCGCGAASDATPDLPTELKPVEGVVLEDDVINTSPEVFHC